MLKLRMSAALYLHCSNLRGVEWDNFAFIINTYDSVGCGVWIIVVITNAGVEVVCAVGL